MPDCDEKLVMLLMALMPRDALKSIVSFLQEKRTGQIALNVRAGAVPNLTRSWKEENREITETVSMLKREGIIGSPGPGNRPS